MKNFKFLIPTFAVAFFLFNSVGAFADGVMQIKGKVVSFDKNEVQVEVNQAQVYTIRRSAMLKRDSDLINQSEMHVSFTVPMDAVKSVKDLPAAKKTK